MSYRSLQHAEVAMNIEPTIRRILILRLPLRNLRVYSLVSEDRRLNVDVTIDSTEVARDWTFAFHSPAGVVSAKLSLHSGSYAFHLASGSPFGSVKETAISVLGKWLIEDEAGKSMGVVLRRFRGTDLISPGGGKIGTVLPCPRNQHPDPDSWESSQSYVWDRAEPTEFDQRLLFACVCNAFREERLQKEV